MRLVADVDAVGGQRKFAVEVEITGRADFDAPDDHLGEARIFELRDAARGVLVDRSTAENSGISDALRRYWSD